MLIHYNRMKEVFGVKAEPELATGFEKVEPDDGDKKVLTAEMIPDHVNITKFCERLSSHAD
jgi:hypothetical protein